jgi:hypothetical protein
MWKCPPASSCLFKTDAITLMTSQPGRLQQKLFPLLICQPNWEEYSAVPRNGAYVLPTGQCFFPSPFVTHGEAEQRARANNSTVRIVVPMANYKATHHRHIYEWLKKSLMLLPFALLKTLRDKSKLIRMRGPVEREAQKDTDPHIQYLDCTARKGQVVNWRVPAKVWWISERFWRHWRLDQDLGPC